MRPRPGSGNAEQLAGFELLARRAVAGLGGWVTLRSADRVLLDTRSAAGSSTSGSAALAETPQVLPRRRGPGVAAGHQAGNETPKDIRNEAAADTGNLAGQGTGDSAHASVVQPVERRGRVQLNLLVSLQPAELQRVVDAQKLPADWVGTVMDDRGVVIARHPNSKLDDGRQVTAEVRARMATAREGLFEAVSPDGGRTMG